MNKTYFQFIAEAAKIHVTTGHLDHVTHFYANPSETFRHFTNVVNRFEGKKSAGTISQKADGGMSVKAGKLPNGTPVVGYKTGEMFSTAEQIAETGKDHYVRSLTPILQSLQAMQMKPGTGFQFDLLHQSDAPTSKKTISQPNTIHYTIPKGTQLSVAAHSQYSVDKNGEMQKTSNTPDVSQLQAPGVHAPELAMGDNIKLGLSSERSKKIKTAVSEAKKSLTPKLAKFARTLVTGEGHHPKFSAFHEQYHSHSSRSSGVRSVEEMRKYVDIFTSKKAQQPAIRKGETKEQHASRAATHKAGLSKELHASISEHEGKFHTLFGIHNQLISAKHHVLDQMREHEHQFQLQTHNGEEHEGLVSSLPEQGMAKFVREGPQGFPKKNNDNPRFAAK